MLNVIMLNVAYAECTIFAFILSVAMLSVVLLGVIMLNVVYAEYTIFALMLSVVLLSVVMLTIPFSP